jgi:bifunctional non-homologous end joining protein LigD
MAEAQAGGRASSTTARTRAGKTIASVYSVRPKPGAPVSTPLRWDELTEDVTPRRFGMREALERVEEHGDLFAPVLAGGQALGAALRKLR